MNAPSVIFVGDFSNERIAWDTVASHLGWTVDRVPDLDALEREARCREVAAVFVDQRTHGASDAPRLKRIRSMVPEARLVICCPIRFVFDIDPAENGAFHVIARPLKLEELQASIGFVWEAWIRRNARNAVAA